MTARTLIDEAVEGRLFMLDLGEDTEYLEVSLPRFSTWYVGKKMAPELVMLQQAIDHATQSSKRQAPLTEAVSRDDKAELKKLVKKELEAYEKAQKAKDLTFVRNVLISFVKSLYAKRSSWTSDLSGDKSA